MVPRAAVSSGRIREVLDEQPTIADPPIAISPQRKGRVEFRDVEFRYPGAEEPVLRDISFEANPGETTAIVGSTGSGKSTLINLLPRFYDASDGQVLIDGEDVRELDRQDLWARIGVIPQKAFLFGGTVASNLRYGDEDATDEDLWRALEIAQGKDFVEEMPEQLEAPIAQGGTNVSGGQRQRLAIARALAKRPEIYVFDDSFSALDFRTDARLRAALARELGHATVIIVAQRVGTILHADRIVVLDEGRVVGHRDPRAADADVRDLPRDRPVPGHRGGGRVSGPMGAHGGDGARPAGGAPGGAPGTGPAGAPGAPGGCGPAVGPAAGRWRPDGRPDDARGEGPRLPPVLQAPDRRAAARERPDRRASSCLAVVSVFLAIIGPKILGNATNVIFEGAVGTQIGQALDQAGIPNATKTRSSPSCGPRARTTWPTCSSR